MVVQEVETVRYHEGSTVKSVWQKKEVIREKMLYEKLYLERNEAYIKWSRPDNTCQKNSIICRVEKYTQLRRIIKNLSQAYLAGYLRPAILCKETAQIFGILI